MHVVMKFLKIMKIYGAMFLDIPAEVSLQMSKNEQNIESGRGGEFFIF